MRRTLITAALLVALALTACGGGGDDEAGASATTDAPTTTSTTAPPSPDDAFLADVEQQLTFEEPGGPEAMLSAAHAVCDSLDASSPGALAADDAANDTPESDAAIADSMASMALGVFFTEMGNDDVAVTMLTLTGDHLCPEHATAIDSAILARGLDLPS